MGFVYIRNKGGLGNQLFIYNFGLLLSRKSNLKLIVDNRTGFFNDKYKRSPLLDKLLINNPVDANLINIFFFMIIKKMPFWLLDLFKIMYLNEENAQTLIDIESLDYKSKRRIYVEGYFQSYNYLLNNKFIIQSQVLHNINYNLFYKNVCQNIINSNSICVHVRRNAYDNLLTKEYFEKSFSEIKDKITKPKFFIFSDSIEWCRQHFNENEETIIVHCENTDDLQEFFLMKNCKHFIIANSTFSWWSAVLSNYSNKMIIAPSNNQLGVVESFYPENWIKL
jgi:hypothetical protein